jgi:hypothetical protein
MPDNQDSKPARPKIKRVVRNRLDQERGGVVVFSSTTTNSKPPPCTVSKKVLTETYERMMVVLSRRQLNAMAELEMNYKQCAVALENTYETVFEALDKVEQEQKQKEARGEQFDEPGSVVIDSVPSAPKKRRARKA